MKIFKHVGESICTLGLDKIQHFGDQPINTNQVYSIVEMLKTSLSLQASLIRSKISANNNNKNVSTTRKPGA